MATDTDGARTGLSRRQMIKASAIAGAAAWTAPMIIDSLSSPAAATSVTCGPGTPNLSYGIIVYLSGSTYYTVKIAGNTCTATNSTSSDVNNCLNYTCGGVTWTNPGGVVTRNGVATSIGNCTNITIHNSGGWVSANNGVTIVFVFAHDGSFGKNCAKISCFACLDQECATVC